MPEGDEVPCPGEKSEQLNADQQLASGFSFDVVRWFDLDGNVNGGCPDTCGEEEDQLATAAEDAALAECDSLQHSMYCSSESGCFGAAACEPNESRGECDVGCSDCYMAEEILSTATHNGIIVEHLRCTPTGRANAARTDTLQCTCPEPPDPTEFTMVWGETVNFAPEPVHVSVFNETEMVYDFVLDGRPAHAGAHSPEGARQRLLFEFESAARYLLDGCDACTGEDGPLDCDGFVGAEGGAVGCEVWHSDDGPQDVVATVEPAAYFERGDCNGDGSVGQVDALYLMQHQFVGDVDPPPCMAACDFNGDGLINAIADAQYLLTYLFIGGVTLAEPAGEPGYADLPDGLTCGS